MNRQVFNNIKASVKSIFDETCKTGTISGPTKKALEKLDEQANELQDDVTDHAEFMECFELREEISGLLNSEAAIHA